MFKKKRDQLETDVNMWCVLFTNPLITKETNQLKNSIKKALKPLQPTKWLEEELTSFVILSTSFSSKIDTEIISSINKTENLQESEFQKFLIEKTDATYKKYLVKLKDFFTNELKKNRELKESVGIIAQRFSLTDEKNTEFCSNLYTSIEQWIENYISVIKNAAVYIIEYEDKKVINLKMSNTSCTITSEFAITELIDELILHNFSTLYIEKTVELMFQFNASLKIINKTLGKVKKKDKDFEIVLDLLKGKSFEIIDNIQDMRRQLARQKGVKDAILSEASELKDTEFYKKIDESNQKERIESIVSLTDVAFTGLNEWFEVIRKIELLNLEELPLTKNNLTISNFCQFYVKMEVLRIWSEYFYDISYYTIRKGRVISAADTKVKEEIETDSVLVVEDVYKTYHLPRSRVYALRGVSLEIKQGEFLAIMGPSGAGKTTLVNLLTGLDSPDKGTVYLEGKNIALMNDIELTEFRRDQVGLIFQFYQLFAELTAIENISMPAEMAGVPVKEARERAQKILEIVDLGKFANQYPDKLSGGQQQRVAIARALINEPAIIVADQLTGDLDSITGQQIIGYLRKINKENNTTVLLVTHNKAVATQADRILMIEDGEITEEIDMSAIRKSDEIVD
ncbi:MAG: ABC transporter ATP-binding protein [Candidatus Heimdallarchaeota archaeon]